jgi:hypothetical protein
MELKLVEAFFDRGLRDCARQNTSPPYGQHSFGARARLFSKSNPDNRKGKDEDSGV